MKTTARRPTPDATLLRSVIFALLLGVTILVGVLLLATRIGSALG